MRAIEQNLTQYAAYHRDRRNIATHSVGIPLILFSIVLALATVWIPVGNLTITLSALIAVAVGAYYLKLDLALGLAMCAVLFLMCAASSEIVHRLDMGRSLGLATALFVGGWALQFLGHKWEGMKPAFIDDAKQLLIGPLFVCTETFFALGLKADLRRYIEDRVGPTVAKRDGRPIPIVDEESHA